MRYEGGFNPRGYLQAPMYNASLYITIITLIAAVRKKRHQALYSGNFDFVDLLLGRSTNPNPF
jgi:hypothetical protein